MFEVLLKIGGVTGLVSGIFYFIYKQALSRGVLGGLSAIQKLGLVGGLAALTWVFAMTALLYSDRGVSANFYGSNNNIVTQNGGHKDKDAGLDNR